MRVGESEPVLGHSAVSRRAAYPENLAPRMQRLRVPYSYQRLHLAPRERLRIAEVPDEEGNNFINDLLRPIGMYLYGRKMYETMAI